MNTNTVRYSFYTLIFMIVAGLITACSTTEEIIKRDEGPQQEETNEITESTGEELRNRLTNTRSKLSDIYLTQQHDMPEAFLKKDTTDNSYNNPFDGYRIQILSTRDVNQADSVATQFRMWADTTFTGYAPKAYVFFKQPHYKVHIGDFQDRQKANNLSRIVKDKYPDAWVVHDRIDPKLVPADTTRIDTVDTGKNNEQKDTSQRPK